MFIDLILNIFANSDLSDCSCCKCLVISLDICTGGCHVTFVTLVTETRHNVTSLSPVTQTYPN